MARLTSIFLCMLMVAVGFGCKRASAPPAGESEGTQESREAPMAAPIAKAETWVSKPFEQWPQIVLTNEADFQGHTSLKGASSFLIRNEKGKVCLATARHLLGAAGDVDPPIKLEDLDKVLLSWRVFPRTKPEEAVRVGGVALPGLDAKDRDWLVLALKTPSAPSAVIPLRLRQKPVAEGETVFMVGCSYANSEATQNVYKGKVTKRYYRDYWRFDIDPPVELPGFSGAPILDKNGLVAGVVTVYFNDPKMRGDKWLEAGGQDVGSIYEAFQSLE